MMSKSRRTLLTDKAGHEYYLLSVDGVNYPDFKNYAQEDYKKFLTKLRNLEIRSDDIVYNGYPKSGNNWMFEIINMIMNHSSDYVPARWADDIIDLQPLHKMDEFALKPSPRVIFSHMNLLTHMPKQMPEKKLKIVYLVRNFKDLIVSAFTWSSTINTYLKYRGTWDSFLDIQFNRDYCYGGWPNHVNTAETFRQKYPDVPFHVVYYEDLKSNLTEEVRKLCHFLGQPDDLAEEIAAKTTFDAMKSDMVKLQEWDKKISVAADAGYLRKGVVNDWKNYFTKEDSDQCDKVIEERMGNNSIVQKLKPYMVQ